MSETSNTPSADRLLEFVTIADAGSIAAAAAELGTPRATLSRRLKALEEELGVRLVNREPRSFGLTPAGERLVEHAREVVAAADRAWRSVEQVRGEPRGDLRVSFPPTHVFTSLLLAFSAAYPKIRLLVRGTSRPVDLHSEPVDVALRFGQIGDDSVVSRVVHNGRASPYASPAYFDAHGVPESVEDLRDHRCLVRFEDGWRPRSTWPLRDGGTAKLGVHLATNELLIRLIAALDGLGIVMVPDELAQPYVESGQLAPVLPGQIAESMPVRVVYSSRRMVSPQVRAFVDFMVEHGSAGVQQHVGFLPEVTPPTKP